MNLARKLSAPVLAIALAVAAVPAMTALPAQASEIAYTINKEPLTSFEIQKRSSFLKLQRQPNGKAAQDMIDQTLRAQEMKRLKISISDSQVDDAYKRFLESNKLTPAQMEQVLTQAGVGKDHFREYIRVQIGWGQALGQRFRSEGRMTDPQLSKRMQEEGKPSATEYTLQQVIFVIPASERGSIMGKRKREAEALRARFSNCDATRDQARGMLDVTVRDLGRVLEPELPPDWEKQIKAAKAGGPTVVRETERGVEFIGICSARSVSNDRVARLVFTAEDAGKNQTSQQLSEKYMKELRDAAQIVKR